MVAAFNGLVDPYGLFGGPGYSSLNAYKPAIQTRVRLYKAFEVRRLRPDSIVLGTSRSHLGFGMSHPAWGARGTYNLAFDGATTEEIYAYLRHAQAVRPLKRVVLGLDTWHIQGNPSAVRPDFDPTILMRPDAPWTHATSRLAEARLNLSWDTASAAFKTLRSQDQATPSWFAPDGQRLGPVFFHRAGEPFVEAGPRQYFLDIDRDEIGFKLPPPPSPPSASPAPAPRSSARREPDSFDYIAMIVAFCRSQGIDLRILITPAHAHQMEISYLMGEIPAIERGKRRLVSLLEADAQAHRAAPFALWDFSGYSTVTTEALPPPGSHAEMQYYWDSSHFKAEVGDWVLDRIFAIERPGQRPPPDFGRRLTPDTIEAALAEIRLGHRAYIEAHQQDLKALAEMLVKARAAQNEPPR